jgi:hypothetical protein
VKRLVPWLLLVVLVAAACGSSGEKLTSGTNEQTDPGITEPDLQTFMYALYGGAYYVDDPTRTDDDYGGGPIKPTPAELAAEPSAQALIVSVTLESVAEGPVEARDPQLPPEIADWHKPWAVLAARVTEIHKGSLLAGSDGFVYVPFTQALLPVWMLDQLLPRGTPAVLYLMLPRGGPEVKNPEAGRPAGQPLYWLRDTGLGFSVALDAHTTLGLGVRFPVPLSEFLPDRTMWPSNEMRQSLTINEGLIAPYLPNPCAPHGCDEPIPAP